MELEFEWDEEKARANLAKHRVSFLTAAEIFADAIIERIDDREDYGEIRLSPLVESTPRSTGSSSPGEVKTLSASSVPRKRAEMNERSTIVRHSLARSALCAPRARIKPASMRPKPSRWVPTSGRVPASSCRGERPPSISVSTAMSWSGSRQTGRGI